MDGIVPSEISEPEKAKDEEAGKNQNAIDETFLRREMHKDQPN
jgi:hypothetical protein